MVNQETIQKQLERIKFNPRGWNKGEVRELHNIILPEEEIYECVNGLYEGGFALLVATDVRVLLVDQKPMGFLNIEDLRFDMINEIDYNHRMMGASIIISTGSKTMKFRSYNKDRLRKLIGHVQHCMAENKKKPASHAEDQQHHLEQINQQLQAYLVAQYKQQQKLHDHLTQLKQDNDSPTPTPADAQMSSQLKDYLYAHGLMDKYRHETGEDPVAEPQPAIGVEVPAAKILPAASHAGGSSDNQLDEIYAEGIQEVFGKRAQSQPAQAAQTPEPHSKPTGFDVNPFKVAISKLPLASFSRRFGISLPPLPAWPGQKKADETPQTLNLNSTTSSGPIT